MPFFFILTYSLGVLTPWIYISRSGAIYCWPGIWRGSYALEELQSLSSWLLVTLLFYSCYSLILSISYPVTFHILIHMLSLC